MRNKLIACMPVRNEEWLLAKTLADLSEYVDEIVCVDDGSTDNTPHILRSFPKVTAIHTNPPGTKPFHNAQESDNRNKVLELARQRGATTILQIDADEIFDDRIKAEMPKLLSRGCSTKFQICHLWDSLDKFRVDRDWGNFYRYRLYALKGHTRFSPQAIIATPKAYDRKNTFKSDVKIVHYGWLCETVRLRSLRRYYEVYRLKHAKKKISWEEFKNSKEMQAELKIVSQFDVPTLRSWAEMLPQVPQDKFALCHHTMSYVTGQKEFAI